MKRARFSLPSDQLELLFAFGECEGLGHLAETMGKDPSVISRGLQKIAEDFPVLAKVRGRWELTPLGRETNKVTEETVARYQKLLPQVTRKRDGEKTIFSQKSVLMVINAQCGLLDATQAGRNNSGAEKNIATLLNYWRSRKMPVVHVRHVSENPGSIFYRQSSGCEFLPEVAPTPGEHVIEKTKSSAFPETSLEPRLREMEPEHLVLAGFTANECIDATAQDAAALGFSTYVVGDATAMFDMRGPDGKWIKAERLHKLTLANLNAFHAKVNLPRFSGHVSQ